ncbi:MAG: class I SAM-dependent methyltransferase [Acidimicrobiales bacterium]|jgi:SAM-dependent methyltransferase
MGLDSLFYRLSYRFGSPRWDTGEPPLELIELVKGLAPGRALDLGCGTGTNAVYLARQGWEVVGVDFAPLAIESARKRGLAAGSSARFVTGNVTNLERAGICGPFDLVVDIGCYHALPAVLRDRYESQVAIVCRSGADFYMAGISHPPASWRLLRAGGVDATELRKRFGADFELVVEQPLGRLGRAPHFVLHQMVRKTTNVPDAERRF